MHANQLITVLLLGGLLGMCGQGIRVIAGLKKRYDKAAEAGENFKDHFDVGTLGLSLFIGFTAGILAVLALYSKINPDNLQSETVMALLGAGYGGADFIEAFMSRAQTKALPDAAPTVTPSASAGDAAISATTVVTTTAMVGMPEPSAPIQPTDPAVG